MVSPVAVVAAIPTIEPAETVNYCPHCKAKTWHINGVCEWVDAHVTASPPEKPSKQQIGFALPGFVR